MAYYQQVGRAGRAVSSAVGVLMSGKEDQEIHQNFRETAFPFMWDIAFVLDALRSHGRCGLTEEQLEQYCNLRPRDIIRVSQTHLRERYPETNDPEVAEFCAF